MTGVVLADHSLGLLLRTGATSILGIVLTVGFFGGVIVVSRVLERMRK